MLVVERTAVVRQGTGAMREQLEKTLYRFGVDYCFSEYRKRLH